MLSLALLLLLSACDELTVPLQVRINPNDWDTQISGLAIVQIEGSLEFQLTVPDPPSYYESEEIVREVLLVYNIGSPPMVPGPVYPPESSGVRVFDKEIGVANYSWTVDGFSTGDELWLAAFPRTDRGWQAPLYAYHQVN